MKQVRNKKVRVQRRLRKERRVRERGALEADNKHRKALLGVRRGVKPVNLPASRLNVPAEIVLPKQEIEPAKPEVDLETEEGEEQEPNTEQLQAVAEEVETVETPEPTVPVKEDAVSRERSNAYSLYLREIGQTKLLTPQEEIALAARI